MNNRYYCNQVKMGMIIAVIGLIVMVICAFLGCL